LSGLLWDRWIEWQVKRPRSIRDNVRGLK
jgi:hypothetical protein